MAKVMETVRKWAAVRREIKATIIFISTVAAIGFLMWNGTLSLEAVEALLQRLESQ
jgi:cell division protein FtsB